MLVITLAYTNIINWLEQHQLPCLFKQAFSIDCPGCGMQRSGIALLRGDVLTSLKLYPALLPLLLFLTYLFINKICGFRLSIKIIGTGIAFIFTVMLVSYIYKIFA